MSSVVYDAKHPLEQLGNPCAGPALATKTICLSPSPQQLREEIQFPNGQPRQSPGAGPRAQAFFAVLAHKGHPLADGAL